MDISDEDLIGIVEQRTRERKDSIAQQQAQSQEANDFRKLLKSSKKTDQPPEETQPEGISPLTSPVIIHEEEVKKSPKVQKKPLPVPKTEKAGDKIPVKESIEEKPAIKTPIKSDPVKSDPVKADPPVKVTKHVDPPKVIQPTPTPVVEDDTAALLQQVQNSLKMSTSTKPKKSMPSENIFTGTSSTLFKEEEGRTVLLVEIINSFNFSVTSFISYSCFTLEGHSKV